MITTDDILGKDVIDPDGDILGVVLTVHVDETACDVTGLTIDQGFGEPHLYVGVNHVDRFGVDAIFLENRPMANLGGEDVYTESGEYLGEVTSVNVVEDDDHVLIIDDGDTTRSIAKSRVVEKGDSVIVEYHEKSP